MTKATKATKSVTTKVIAASTVVVHNYAEFTHGIILEHLHNNTYRVYFPADMSPKTAKYQASTADAYANRTRTITFGKGFFISRFKTIDDVRTAQAYYKRTGLALES